MRNALGAVLFVLFLVPHAAWTVLRANGELAVIYAEREMFPIA